jgi:hypothetical protein
VPVAGFFGAACVLGIVLGFQRPASAASTLFSQTSPFDANTSDSARKDAVKSIPLGKLAPADQAKVRSVLSSVSVFRRMPVKVIDCDPDLYLFLVRHPDVVTSIWEVFKISRLQLRQVGENQFRLFEPAGATASIESIYRSHDIHVFYGEGTYEGPLLTRPVKGRGVLILKTGYVREPNGRYYITSRLDSLLSVEPFGAELLAKTVSPLIGKTVDNNFVQTVAFVSSLSRTAELNRRNVLRLASKLEQVQPDVRRQFAEVAGKIEEKSAAVREESAAAKLAAHPKDKSER